MVQDFVHPQQVPQLGALLPFLFGEGFAATVDYRKKGTLILTSLLEDPVEPPYQSTPVYECGGDPGFSGESSL